MLDPELMAVLVCPATHQDLSEADETFLGGLNESIGRGDVRNVQGQLVAQAVDGALIRADGAIAYPVRDGIPVMLVNEGLVLAGLEAITRPVS